MAPYYDDYSNLHVSQARTHVARVIRKIAALLMEANEQYDDSARLTFESLENALQKSIAVTMTRQTQRLIDLTKCAAILSELLCDRPELLRTDNWNFHPTLLNGLLLSKTIL